MCCTGSLAVVLLLWRRDRNCMNSGEITTLGDTEPHHSSWQSKELHRCCHGPLARLAMGDSETSIAFSCMCPCDYDLFAKVNISVSISAARCDNSVFIRAILFSKYEIAYIVYAPQICSLLIGSLENKTGDFGFSYRLKYFFPPIIWKTVSIGLLQNTVHQ